MKQKVVYDLNDDRWLVNIGQSQNQKNVVLTFDDGPSRHLPAILDILKVEKVPAVFFWQTRLLHKKRPWKQVLKDGHQIGSHGHNHKLLTKLSLDQQYKQIQDSVNKIKQITDEDVQWFRPPFGQYNEDTMKVLAHLQLTPTMWEISSFDWENKKQPNAIISNVVDYVCDGSIILLHELSQTASILKTLIEKVKEKGFHFTSL